MADITAGMSAGAPPGPRTRGGGGGSGGGGGGGGATYDEEGEVLWCPHGTAGVVYRRRSPRSDEAAATARKPDDGGGGGGGSGGGGSGEHFIDESHCLPATLSITRDLPVKVVRSWEAVAADGSPLPPAPSPNASKSIPGPAPGPAALVLRFDITLPADAKPPGRAGY